MGKSDKKKNDDANKVAKKPRTNHPGRKSTEPRKNKSVARGASIKAKSKARDIAFMRKVQKQRSDEHYKIPNGSFLRGLNDIRDKVCKEEGLDSAKRKIRLQRKAVDLLHRLTEEFGGTIIKGALAIAKNSKRLTVSAADFDTYMRNNGDPEMLWIARDLAMGAATKT